MIHYCVHKTSETELKNGFIIVDHYNYCIWNITLLCSIQNQWNRTNEIQL